MKETTREPKKKEYLAHFSEVTVDSISIGPSSSESSVSSSSEESSLRPEPEPEPEPYGHGSPESNHGSDFELLPHKYGSGREGSSSSSSKQRLLEFFAKNVACLLEGWSPESCSHGSSHSSPVGVFRTNLPFGLTKFTK